MNKNYLLPITIAFLSILFLSFMTKDGWFNGDDFAHIGRDEQVMDDLLQKTFSGILLYFILFKYTGNRTRSILGMLLFLYYPAISTTLFWISAMGDVLSTAFALGVLLLFVYFRDDKKVRSTTSNSRHDRYIVSVLY